jgi:hypothetical protein
VQGRTHRNIPDRQSITGLDRASEPLTIA